MHAELTCLSCGYEIGDVEGRKGARLDELVFLPVHQGDELKVDERGRFRCPRCKSRVLLQGVMPAKHPIDRETVHEAVLDGSVTRGLMY